MALFFISDTHFWHKNVMKYTNRPFDSVEHMNSELIKRWQSVVKPEDTIIVVGDVFFCGNGKARIIMEQLPGKKILVRGNHDNSARKMEKLGFDFVCESMVMKLGGEYINICHYPYRPSFWERFTKKMGSTVSEPATQAPEKGAVAHPWACALGMEDQRKAKNDLCRSGKLELFTCSR